MKVKDYIQPENIFLDVALSDKDAVLHFAAERLAAQKGITHQPETIYQGLTAREAIMSSGVGEGIGMPHTLKLESELKPKQMGLILIRPSQPIDFDAIDDTPVDIIFVTAMTSDQGELHLQILAAISRLCRNQDFCHAIRTAPDSRTLYQIIMQTEQENDPEPAHKSSHNQYLLIVVINNEDYIEELVSGWLECGINGGTVIESTDMIQLISYNVPIFAGFRALTNGGAMRHNKTIFTAVKDRWILEKAVRFVEGLLKRSGKPHQGIYFVLPIIALDRLGLEVDSKTHSEHIKTKLGRPC